MARSIAAGEWLKERLEFEGLTCTLDVRDVLGLAPCVLIPPPRWIDWAADGEPVYQWRLVAISGQAVGNLDAWRELDDLVTALAAILPVELAEPVGYPLPTGGAPLPAYVVTYTGS